MSEGLSRSLRLSLNQRTLVVGRHLRCEARNRFEAGAPGGPCVWLEALGKDMRYVPVVYLSAPKGAEGYRYVVGRAGDPAEPLRFAFEQDAATAFKTEAMAHGKTLPLLTRRPVRVSLRGPGEADAVQSTHDAPASVFSLGEAVRHPLIRATVIAGHETAKASGTPWDPLHVLGMAQAAMGVIEAQDPGSSSDPGKHITVERALVGILVGALAAVDAPVNGPAIAARGQNDSGAVRCP